MILPSTIHAACTEEEKMHFKEIEDQYRFTYEFDRESEDYTITFYNPEPKSYDFNLYIVYDIDCDYYSDNEYKCFHIRPGDVEIGIFSKNKSCETSLKDTMVHLEKNNSFSKDELCIGIEEFVLCQPTYDKEIDYETFVSRTNAYRKTKAEKQTKEEEKKEQPINNIVNFIQENLIYVIAVPVLLIAVIITVILTAKSIRKSRRLE